MFQAPYSIYMRLRIKYYIQTSGLYLTERAYTPFSHSTCINNVSNRCSRTLVRSAIKVIGYYPLISTQKWDCSCIGHNHTILKAKREITGKIDIEHWTRTEGQQQKRREWSIQSDGMAQHCRCGHSCVNYLFIHIRYTDLSTDCMCSLETSNIILLIGTRWRVRIDSDVIST